MSDYNTQNNSGAVCFRCCFSFILTLGLTTLFMWLSLRTSNPVLSIQDVYIPALNKTLNSTSYQSIYLDIKLDNENKDKGVYYDQINITIRYHYNNNNNDHMNTTTTTPSRNNIPISNYTIPGFYQGHKKHTQRKFWTDTHGLLPLDGMAIFRVDLMTGIRFKILFWKTKKHRIYVGADFEVTEKGQKVQKKGTRLKSGVLGLFSGHSPGASLLDMIRLIMAFERQLVAFKVFGVMSQGRGYVNKIM